MAAWHRTRRADLGLRVVGLCLIGLAYLAIAGLVGLHVPPKSASPLAFGLAAAGFLCGSMGGALTMLGNHLSDEIEISARWAQRAPETRSRKCLQMDSKQYFGGDGSPNSCGRRDADGKWTVRESARMLLGRFGTHAAALRFAARERQARPAIQIASSAGTRPRLRGRLTLARSSRVEDGAPDA